MAEPRSTPPCHAAAPNVDGTDNGSDSDETGSNQFSVGFHGNEVNHFTPDGDDEPLHLASNQVCNSMSSNLNEKCDAEKVCVSIHDLYSEVCCSTCLINWSIPASSTYVESTITGDMLSTELQPLVGITRPHH